MARIRLEGMEFFAYHGVYPEERANGGRFRVELSFETDIQQAGKSDDLNDTVDYSAVYALVADEMNRPSKLLEHLATRMLERISTAFPAISRPELRITKLLPPIEGNISGVSIILTNPA